MIKMDYSKEAYNIHNQWMRSVDMNRVQHKEMDRVHWE